MKTNYAGIDYGLGKSNRNSETGIRNGVISQNDVGQAWFDESEPYYGKPHCPKCGNEASELKGKYERYEHAEHECDDHVCHHCRYVFGSESAYGDSPISHYYEQSGYSAECGEDGDIFVCRSPYFHVRSILLPMRPGCLLSDKRLGRAERQQQSLLSLQGPTT